MLLNFVLKAQQVDEVSQKPGVQMIGRAQKDRILLRWAPTNPTVWQYTLKYGFIVERYTILRNKVMLDLPEKITLTPSPLKAWPLAQWESLVNEDDWAGIAAEAIYSEKFEITESFSSDMASAINKVKEIDNRYSFAMFAADQSRRAAQASGLFFEDAAAKPNEKYLYRVYSPVPAEKIKLDTGFVYIGLADYSDLPLLSDVQFTLEDKAAVISWPGRKYNHIYNSFILERSDDGGKSYQATSEVPIINTSNIASAPEYVMKGDSLPAYNINYLYRVKGITAFGEISPPSESVSIVAHPLLNYMPRIYGTTVSPNGTISIRWEFPAEGQDLIQGFKLYRSDKAKGVYQVLEKNILPTVRATIDKAPINSNYYVLAAFDRYGNETRSLSSLAMLEDSIPPTSPVNLQGKIDTAGVVTLSWDKNKELDLHGYRVYRANLATEEYVQITKNPVREPVFTDTIEIRTLTKDIYYKVAAIDNHYNPSTYSDSLLLARPDVIAPAPPVFESINNNTQGITIKWINSSSEDVTKHVLYRRSATDTGWAPIYILNGKDSIGFFTDSLTIVKELYAYTVIAVDESGLESIPAKPVSAKRVDLGVKSAVQYINAQVDRNEKRIQLSWRYPEKNVLNYRIYRAEENGNLSLHKVVSASTAETFNDKDLKVNTNYRYRVQAEFKHGILSPMSKEVKVNF